MKNNEYQLETNLTVSQIKQRVQSVLGKAEIGPIQSTVLDERADLEFLAQRKGLAGHSAIQLFVYNRGHMRDVQVVALGDSGVSRALGGLKTRCPFKEHSVGRTSAGITGVNYRE